MTVFFFENSYYFLFNFYFIIQSTALKNKFVYIYIIFIYNNLKILLSLHSIEFTVPYKKRIDGLSSAINENIFYRKWTIFSICGCHFVFQDE